VTPLAAKDVATRGNPGVFRRTVWYLLPALSAVAAPIERIGIGLQKRFCGGIVCKSNQALVLLICFSGPTASCVEKNRNRQRCQTESVRECAKAYHHLLAEFEWAYRIIGPGEPAAEVTWRLALPVLR